MYVLLAPVGLTKGRCVCFTGSSWFDQGEVCMGGVYVLLDPVGLTKGSVCMFYWLQLV